ncbi:MAG TPA: DUF1326 domain-containing protein [Thermomicrobiaceae bacterium]|nr:DUF1326 domain-containing protein [Thermomicrobiaceae bacterium]
MAYEIEGRLLEVCDCNVLCPCWIGENPDDGTCDAIVAYHIDQGTIGGVDVAGRTFALVTHVPGNAMAGNWKALAVVDGQASDRQLEALLNAFTGKLGGPLADLAQLVGEVVGVERARVTFEVTGGRGLLKLGTLAEAELEPYVGPSGQTTTLNESIFSTIPGSPAYVSKALSYTRQTASYGLPDVDLSGHNAIQGGFRFEA